MTSPLITVLTCLSVLFFSAGVDGAEQIVWLEAEQFEKTGGWSNDSQHVDIMGSPYLLATGVGKPIEDAVTTARIPKTGKYRLWVRCRDWLPDHSPGQFQVLVERDPSWLTCGKGPYDAWPCMDGGML